MRRIRSLLESMSMAVVGILLAFGLAVVLSPADSGTSAGLAGSNSVGSNCPSHLAYRGFNYVGRQMAHRLPLGRNETVIPKSM
jgi:hypothetical protein